MNERIAKLKSKIVELCKNPGFIHQQWFVKYHLEIVDKIANELCDTYNDADREIVNVLIWVHDYAKIVDFSNKDDLSVFRRAIPLLQEVGYDKNFITQIMNHIDIIESDVVAFKPTPLEVQIITSADGSSHFFGPFFQIFLYEYHTRSIDELLEGNLRKFEKNLKTKIVLPEAKHAVEARLSFLKEHQGILPAKYL